MVGQLRCKSSLCLSLLVSLLYHARGNSNLTPYDKAIVEIPQFFIEECVEFYPDAKFIIVERDINAWERSLNNTVLPVFDGCRSFPMNISQYFDNFVKAFVASHIEFEDAMFHNKGIRAGMEDAKRDMISEYV